MISIVKGKTEISLNVQDRSNCTTVPATELPLKGAEVFETGLRMGPSRMLVGRPVSNTGADLQFVSTSGTSF